MERESMEEGAITSSLIVDQQQPDDDKNAMDRDSSATTVLLFSTFVALFGSFSYGCGGGYSSPAESGIMDDLDLSIAELLPKKVGLSGRGSGRLSKWSRIRALVDAANFLGRGPRIAPDSTSED